VLTGLYYRSIRDIVHGEIRRSSLKLTDKQAGEGLLRFRIVIDLDESPVMALEARGLGVATVKFVYPEPK
jgi:hypothetical protein